MRLGKVFGGYMVFIKVGKLIAFSPADLPPGVYPREVISYTAQRVCEKLII